MALTGKSFSHGILIEEEKVIDRIVSSSPKHANGCRNKGFDWIGTECVGHWKHLTMTVLMMHMQAQSHPRLIGTGGNVPTGKYRYQRSGLNH